MTPALRERLAAGLVHCPDPDCECLLWTGTHNQGGYGVITFGNRHHFVHRVIWQLEVGSIPDGLFIDHVREHGCRHRNCANIGHLEPVTLQVNSARGVRATAAHCVRGHAFDEANTYRKSDGSRRCRACHREEERRRRAGKPSPPVLARRALLAPHMPALSETQAA